MQAGKYWKKKIKKIKKTTTLVTPVSVGQIWSGRHVVTASIVAFEVQWNCCGVPLANYVIRFHKAHLTRITIDKLQGRKKVCAPGLFFCFVFCLFQNSVCISAVSKYNLFISLFIKLVDILPLLNSSYSVRHSLKLRPGHIYC